VSRADAFIRPVTSSKLYRPDGTVKATKCPAVWTLAHRGYSGGGRLDIWVYRTKAAALYAGADLAMEAGLDEDPKARRCSSPAATRSYQSHYNRHRPHQARDQLPPDAQEHPTAEHDLGARRLLRTPILGGIIKEYRYVA
jgi:hypothetical protein